MSVMLGVELIHILGHLDLHLLLHGGPFIHAALHLVIDYSELLTTIEANEDRIRLRKQVQSLENPAWLRARLSRLL